ncbi:hypothetical protein BDQ94DRAFT_144087 [Aspergillus welwitschiae]|uniref:Uncharacterized protein n=1 Tax=Aspergillus welwitschiae TaxID=1341132 RepID=A0A3F3Q2S9_9EURO|nr:hypothetical protein BDQ94DRAFT_144087 [Aspergillus welwitschiae]RDH33405.1 hypothetical protein BDQ94DRAFT_144087 [Aspergillus welwitschiae]
MVVSWSCARCLILGCNPDLAIIILCRVHDHPHHESPQNSYNTTCSSKNGLAQRELIQLSPSNL